jgi:hypothetical protein
MTNNTKLENVLGGACTSEYVSGLNPGHFMPEVREGRLPYAVNLNGSN